MFKRIVVCNEGFLVGKGIKIFDPYVKESSILIAKDNEFFILSLHIPLIMFIFIREVFTCDFCIHLSEFVLYSVYIIFDIVLVYFPIYFEV